MDVALTVSQAVGNDSSAARFGGACQTLTKARDLALIGDTIEVLDGIFVENNLWKAGVTWEFHGAVTVDYDASSKTPDSPETYGIFDDRAGGVAVTCQNAAETITLNNHRRANGELFNFVGGTLPAPLSTAVTCDAGTDVITQTAHGYSAGTRLQFSGSPLPAGIGVGFDYFVISPTTNTYQISLTLGGPAVDFTSAGTSVQAFQPIESAKDYYVLNASANTFQFASQVGGAVIPFTSDGSGVTITGICRILGRGTFKYKGRIDDEFCFGLFSTSNSGSVALFEANYLECSNLLSTESGAAIFARRGRVTLDINEIEVVAGGICTALWWGDGEMYARVSKITNATSFALYADGVSNPVAVSGYFKGDSWHTAAGSAIYFASSHPEYRLWLNGFAELIAGTGGDALHAWGKGKIYLTVQKIQGGTSAINLGLSGARASGVLTGDGPNFSNNETATIDAKTYTFQTTLTNVDGNVLIGASLAVSLQNLKAAINLEAGAGTVYAAATKLHPTVTIEAITSTKITVVSKTAGLNSNSIVTAENCANAQWGKTLAGGVGIPVNFAAAGVLTATANFGNNETVTIDTKAYTFQTTLSNVDGNVLIGASTAASLQNLKAAINLEAGAGSLYAAATTLHRTVSAVTSTTTELRVSAKVTGNTANFIATTETCANAAWGARLAAGVTGELELYFNSHKFTGGSTANPVVLAVATFDGKIWGRVEYIEDLGSASSAIEIAGTGKTNISGQEAKTLNGKGLVVRNAGTTRISGFRFDTTNTNAAGNHAVDLGDLASGLVLQQCVLLAPSAANGINLAVNKTITCYRCFTNKASGGGGTLTVNPAAGELAAFTTVI